MGVILLGLAGLALFYILIGLGLGTWSALVGYRAYKEPLNDAYSPSMAQNWASMREHGLSNAAIVRLLLVVSAWSWPKAFRD